MTSRAILSVLFLTLSLATTGCDPLGNSRSRLRVRTITTGSNIDSDGYLVKLDQKDPVRIGVNAQMDFEVDATVPHDFAIYDVSANCAGGQANGTFSATLELFPGETRTVQLELVCVAPTS